MASPTTDKHEPPAQQKPMAVATDLPRTLPTLVEDIDRVLLLRLYPGYDDIDDARRQALAAGKRTHDEGEKLIAAQQQTYP